MKNPKVERWRNQTLVNRVNNDFAIATEYYTLVDCIVESFNKANQRFEIIQNPLLHLMSHCIELRYKYVLLFAAEHYCKNNNITVKSIVHTHNLFKLYSEFAAICQQLQTELGVSDDDKDLIKSTILPKNQQLVSILQSNTTSYRYAKRRNKSGKVVGAGSPINSDKDSPNIMDLYPLFEECNTNIVYVLTILEAICVFRTSC